MSISLEYYDEERDIFIPQVVLEEIQRLLAKLGYLKINVDEKIIFTYQNHPPNPKQVIIG